jgi:prepilin-type N-terminal cleavage/methylation domain-containing protein
VPSLMPSLRHWRPREVPRGDDAGFTMIEVVAAMLVFALAAAAIVAMLTNSLQISRTNRQRVVAANLATQELENVRNDMRNGVPQPVGVTSHTQTVGATTYTVKRTANWLGLGQAGDSCSGALSGQIAYQRVKVAVTWPNMSGVDPVTNDTVITPEPGTLSPNTITIPVHVVDRNGASVPGQSVTVTPVTAGPSQSEVTDDSGCAVFAQLTPGSYNISLNTPGYVDWQGVSNHVESGGSSTPGIVPVVTIPYDQLGSLTLAPSAPAGYTAPPAASLTYTLSQVHWTANPQLSTTAPLTHLFPFANDLYTGYAGTCTDSKPAGFTPPGVLVPPNGAATLNVPFAPANFLFKRNGVALSGYTVTATDSTCAPAVNYTFAGTTDATGNLKMALPYGAWSFKVTKAGTTYTTSGATTARDQNSTTAQVTVNVS